MNKYEDHELEQLRDTVREGRSVAALILILTLLFVAYFAMRVAMPAYS